jgi:hypothetical protein
MIADDQADALDLGAYFMRDGRALNFQVAHTRRVRRAIPTSPRRPEPNSQIAGGMGVV